MRSPCTPRTDVVVCRGCCCGTDRKHPDVDHALQGVLLRQAAESTGGTLRRTDCLGPCEQSNVVVVRRAGERPQWFGHVLNETATAALVAWVAAGAHGEPPATIASHRFHPGRDRDDRLEDTRRELVLLPPTSRESAGEPRA